MPRKNPISPTTTYPRAAPEEIRLPNGAFPMLPGAPGTRAITCDTQTTPIHF
ncbi:MAG: hypothetical protein IJJ23_06905 [Clostridia bacterium]|nr:hypothetical protein [Clostridia bacterium]